MAVDVYEGGDEACERIEAAGEEDMVEEPDEIGAPAEPEPEHAAGADAAADCSYVDEGNVLHRFQDRRGGCIILDSRVGVQGFQGGESTREDQESRQKDPTEERSKNIMQARYSVHRKKHVHVPGLRTILPVQSAGTRTGGFVIMVFEWDGDVWEFVDDGDMVFCWFWCSWFGGYGCGTSSAGFGIGCVAIVVAFVGMAYGKSVGSIHFVC